MPTEARTARASRSTVPSRTGVNTPAAASTVRSPQTWRRRPHANRATALGAGLRCCRTSAPASAANGTGCAYGAAGLPDLGRGTPRPAPARRCRPGADAACRWPCMGGVALHVLDVLISLALSKPHIGGGDIVLQIDECLAAAPVSHSAPIGVSCASSGSATSGPRPVPGSRAPRMTRAAARRCGPRASPNTPRAAPAPVQSRAQDPA